MFQLYICEKKKNYNSDVNKSVIRLFAHMNFTLLQLCPTHSIQFYSKTKKIKNKKKWYK